MLPKLDSGSSLAHGTIPFYMQPKLIGWHVESKIALTENVCTCVHLKLHVYIIFCGGIYHAKNQTGFNMSKVSH